MSCRVRLTGIAHHRGIAGATRFAAVHRSVAAITRRRPHRRPQDWM